jgi:hypothetical protein
LGDLAGSWIDGVGGTGLVLLRPGGGAASTGGLLQTVAVAVHRQDMDVVRQPIEQRTGEPLGSQDTCPVLEGKIGRDDRGAALVALREHFEQKLGTGRR